MPLPAVRALLPGMCLALSLASAQPNGWVDMGGYKLYLECQGPQTTPAVLVIGSLHPLPNDPAEQAGLFYNLTAFTRTCLFDPPGKGQSDPAPKVADGRARAEELHRLLVKQGVKSPLVIVAYGLSSQLARLYTERYRSGVAGLVLIGPWHEDLPAAMVNFFRSNPPARAGISGEMNDWLNGFHSYVQAYQAGHAPPMTQWDIRAGDQQARGVKPFGKLPVVVVTSRVNMFTGMGEGPTVTYGQRLTQVFATQQAKLLKISSNSREAFLDLNDPNSKAMTETEVEEAAVRAVLDAARRGTPLPRSITVP